MAESSGKRKSGGIAEGAQVMRRDLSRQRLNQVAERRLEEQPMLRHLLAWNVVLPAALLALALGALFAAVVAPKLGALVLIVTFAGAWYWLARFDYDKRRPSSPASDDEDEEA